MMKFGVKSPKSQNMKKKNLLITAAVFSPFCCLAQTTPASHPTDAEAWIAFLPPIFFLLILMVTTVKLRNDKTKLSDLLAEKDPTPAVTTGTPTVALANGDNAPAVQPCSQSVSRFIAFLTGLVALSIGVCICTFYMYSYFTNQGKTVDLSNLTNVIWGLGIGVLPYGFNKASSAIKSNA